MTKPIYPVELISAATCSLTGISKDKFKSLLQNEIEAAGGLLTKEAAAFLTADHLGVRTSSKQTKFEDQAWVYNFVATKSRETLTDNEALTNKAHENALAQRVFNLQKEAMQMLYMIDQLQVMLPGKYEDILEEVLMDVRAKITERGGNIHE